MQNRAQVDALLEQFATLWIATHDSGEATLQNCVGCKFSLDSTLLTGGCQLIFEH